MEQLRFVETAYKIMHDHRDGGWGEMLEEKRAHHSPADHDPERGWAMRRIFRCTSCDESLTIVPGSEGGPDERR